MYPSVDLADVPEGYISRPLSREGNVLVRHALRAAPATGLVLCRLAAAVASWKARIRVVGIKKNSSSCARLSALIRWNEELA